jgi:hypothetical protein
MGVIIVGITVIISWSHHFKYFTVATMTWLTVTEYLFNKWQRICPFSYGHCIVHIHLYVIIYYSFEHECPNKNVDI